MLNSFGRLLSNQHFYLLAMRLGRQFGVLLDPDLVESSFRSHTGYSMSDRNDWTDVMWVEWFREVLVQNRLLPPDPSLHEDRRSEALDVSIPSSANDDWAEYRGPIWLGVKLHVFFMHI